MNNGGTAADSAAADCAAGSGEGSLEFEIFGKVQGVFFRKHTHKAATTKGLRGWCRNMPSGTVAGKAEGDVDRLAEFKVWLTTRGSPKSRIDRAVFENERPITTPEVRTCFARPCARTHASK